MTWAWARPRRCWRCWKHAARMRAAGEPVGPSLVVVPRSLIFNWKQEAARFTPATARARLHRRWRATADALPITM